MSTLMSVFSAADAVTYRQAGYADVTLDAIFTEIPSESGSPGAVTQMEILAGQTTATPANGDVVIIGTTEYRVSDQPILHPLGQSWILQLRKAP